MALTRLLENFCLLLANNWRKLLDWGFWFVSNSSLMVESPSGPDLCRLSACCCSPCKLALFISTSLFRRHCFLDVLHPLWLSSLSPSFSSRILHCSRMGKRLILISHPVMSVLRSLKLHMLQEEVSLMSAAQNSNLLVQINITNVIGVFCCYNSISRTIVFAGMLGPWVP